MIDYKIIFKSKSEKKNIKVWGSNEERSLIESKAYNYDYRMLTLYIRDAAVYERITNYKIEGEDEILNVYCESNKEIYC